MLSTYLYTTDETAWRDAARRLHRATIDGVGDVAGRERPSAACRAEVFVGAAQAEVAAIERALAAGRHALVVAEPCLTPASLRALAAAAARRGVQFAVVSPDRFLPSRQMVKSQLGGPLGSPELVRIHRWESHAAAATTSPLELPGPLVAELEQAVWLMGRVPQTVFAVEPQGAAAGTNGARMLQVHLSFCPGMAIIDYSDRLPDATRETSSSGGAAAYRSLSVIGSSGSAQTDDQANAQLLYGGGLPQGVVGGEGVKSLAAILDDFATAIETIRDPSAGLQAWHDTAAVVEAVRQSIAHREAVAVVAGGTP
jgi:predicted dehydrogenase